MLFTDNWRQLRDSHAQLPWWQQFLLSPLCGLDLIAAATCYFPKLTVVGFAAVLITYSILIGSGIYSLGDLLAKAGGLLLVFTVGTYVIVGVEFLAEATRRYYSTSAQHASIDEADSDSTA